MNFQPITAVWELTFRCNMNCKHCGSSCIDATKPDELTPEEALSVARQMGALNLQHVTLSGGEPLLRNDWPAIATALTEVGVTPNIISNGWFCNERVVDQALAAGISNMAFSIDGLEETHDFMRKPTSFARIMAALGLLRHKGLPSSVITTITKRNLPELRELRKILNENGVYSWQIQIGTPMGNFVEQQNLHISPFQIDEIIDFAYETMEENKIKIYLADCLGYYSRKDVEIRKRAADIPGYSGIWQGCQAGKSSFGLLCNGDVVGCTSIRAKSFIEGNVRQHSLLELWNSDKSFVWNRCFDVSALRGFCGVCQYKEVCRGGCSVSKLTFGGTILENYFCTYRNHINKLAIGIENLPINELTTRGFVAMQNNDLQPALLYLEKAAEMLPTSSEVQEALGFVHYQLGNYEACREANERALKHKFAV